MLTVCEVLPESDAVGVVDVGTSASNLPKHAVRVP